MSQSSTHGPIHLETEGIVLRITSSFTGEPTATTEYAFDSEAQAFACSVKIETYLRSSDFLADVRALGSAEFDGEFCR